MPCSSSTHPSKFQYSFSNWDKVAYKSSQNNCHQNHFILESPGSKSCPTYQLFWGCRVLPQFIQANSNTVSPTETPSLTILLKIIVTKITSLLCANTTSTTAIVVQWTINKLKLFTRGKHAGFTSIAISFFVVARWRQTVHNGRLVVALTGCKL